MQSHNGVILTTHFRPRNGDHTRKAREIAETKRFGPLRPSVIPDRQLAYRAQKDTLATRHIPAAGWTSHRSQSTANRATQRHRPLLAGVCQKSGVGMKLIWRLFW
jgi:hypothetical protein